MDPLRTINPTIDVYIDLARELNGLSSDRRVAQALGVTPATVNAWRSKRQWPSDQAMIRLADLTQRARECALVDLNMWRARTPAVRQTYGKILGRLTGMTGTPIVTLEAHHRRRTREREDAARQRRNIAIMRLAARGWQNKRIAQHVGLGHPNSVSRIIQRQLRVNAAWP